MKKMKKIVLIGRLATMTMGMTAVHTASECAYANVTMVCTDVKNAIGAQNLILMHLTVINLL
jgi:hypothetical protein